ncbi:MerR family transcriptional regulator [Limosilactobacillus pontis]|uniref:MerR family transcriptional regulator n=1 Tax=Limosilactobacillus pontis TaxID=35787 RepID=A0ABU7SQP0_9LACO
MYTSGQLAKHCRVSVRTVQYYDQQGLLHARRTTSNQRRYQEDDLRRLQRILAYRQLGFTIKDIRELLDQQDDQALRTAITLQEQRTQQELQAAQDRLTGLKYLRDQLVHTGNFPGNIAAHVKRSHAHRLTRLRVRTALIGLLVDLLIWGSLVYVVWNGASIGWLVAGILASLILIGGSWSATTSTPSTSALTAKSPLSRQSENGSGRSTLPTPASLPAPSASKRTTASKNTGPTLMPSSFVYAIKTHP